MAFCTKCGRRLEDGEICTCQQQKTQEIRIHTEEVVLRKAPVQTQQAAAQDAQGTPYTSGVHDVQVNIPQSKGSGETVNHILKKVGDDIVNLLKKPVTQGKIMIKKGDLTVSAFFIFLQGILSALFAMLACKHYSAGISAIGSTIDEYSGIFGRDTEAANLLRIPYLRIFCITFICSVLFSLLLSVLLFIGNKLCRQKLSLSQAVSAASVRSAILAPVLLMSFLLFALNATFGMMVFFGANIWGLSVMVLSLQPEGEKDAFSYMITCVLSLFFFLNVFCMLKMWTMYLPDTLQTVVSNSRSLMELWR